MKQSVTKCDRCGEVETVNGSAFTEIKIQKSYSKNKVYSRSIKKDLCPTCTILLETFMKGEPPPELVPALVPVH